MSILEQIKQNLHNNYSYVNIEEELAKLDMCIICALTPEQLATLIGNIKKCEDTIYRKYSK